MPQDAARKKKKDLPGVGGVFSQGERETSCYRSEGTRPKRHALQISSGVFLSQSACAGLWPRTEQGTGQGWRMRENEWQNENPLSLVDPACPFLVRHCPCLSCSVPLQRVSEVSNHWWYSMLILPPLLKDSVAAPLLSAYYPDCVGMSPSCTSTHRVASDTSPGKLEHLKAVPSVLGERWAWPSLPPLPSLALEMCGWAGWKRWFSCLFVLNVFTWYSEPHISWIWFYCGSLILFVYIS